MIVNDVESPPKPRPRELPPLVRLAIDFGPLIVFFIVYNLGRAHMLGVTAERAIFPATAWTMGASAVAIVISLALTRRISPALLITSGFAISFGALTIALNDSRFVKIKPTIVYALYATGLLIGVAARRPLLKYILGQGFPPLAEAGWMKLSRNFGLFFLLMGAINELVWRSFPEKIWVLYDVWGVVAITGAFMASQYGVISKYLEDEPQAETEAAHVTPPPPG